MKSILIIGIGRFGQHLARRFSELDNEVMIADVSESKIQELLPFVTNGQIGDCTDPAVLKTLGVRNYDICFVCVGSNFQSSLEITSLIKEMGARRVVSRAGSQLHAKFLLHNGADEVVYPEFDTAQKLAFRLSAANVFDFIDLTENVSICEIGMPTQWAGQTIGQLSIRNKYAISVLATKIGDTVSPMPTADRQLNAGEHLIVMGGHKDIEKVLKMVKEDY